MCHQVWHAAYAFEQKRTLHGGHLGIQNGGQYDRHFEFQDGGHDKGQTFEARIYNLAALLGKQRCKTRSCKIITYMFGSKFHDFALRRRISMVSAYFSSSSPVMVIHMSNQTNRVLGQ